MKLPENKRRMEEGRTNWSIWIYGAPFSGKTTFADKFDNVLMINTDGNTRYTTAPYILIRNEIYKEGRMFKTKYGWDEFIDTIAELEKDTTYETIVIDLIDDIYSMARQSICANHGWSHESDDSTKAWDIVRSEFIDVMRRLLTLPNKNKILISHEDKSRNIMKSGGDQVTEIKPNIQDKVANKIAGMVDVVGRVTADHKLSFEISRGVFGGGRIHKTLPKEIDLDKDEFLKAIV